MTKFIVKKLFKSLSLTDPILIEGLPGIGNVGKIAVDFLVDELNPTPLYEIYSFSFPHSVFVTEDNTVELPAVKIYHFRKEGRDFLFLSGDVQPEREYASYAFSDKVLELARELGCKELITLGGLGREAEVKAPKVFGTATDISMLNKYRDLTKNVNFNVNKSIANIFGVTGVLLGLAQINSMKGVCFLVDTYAHPMHIGLKESKALIEILNNLFGFNLDLSKLDQEIKESTQYLEKARASEEQKYIRKLKKQLGGAEGDTSYFG